MSSYDTDHICYEFILPDRKTVLSSTFIPIPAHGLKKGEQFISDRWKDSKSGLPLLMTCERCTNTHIYMKGGGGILIDYCMCFVDPSDEIY